MDRNTLDRAEQRALETYPMETGGVDCYPISRAGYIAGYHQAEKDLALTWKDMKRIWNIFDDIIMYDKVLGTEANEEFFKETLKRFLEGKKV